MGSLVSIACAVAFGLSLPQGPSSARAEPRPPEKPLPPPPVAVPDDSSGDPGSRPTAEDILKALQRQRPVNEVIPPAGVTDWPPTRRGPLLLPEGAAVVSQSGRLKAEGPWWTFSPDPPDDKPPTKLLPNANLEVMVRTAAGSPTPVKFVVSGEVTVFDDENYMLVRVVRRAAASDAPQPTPERAVEHRSPSPPQSSPGPQQPSAVRGAGDEANARPSPEDVVALLQQQRPKEEVMLAPSGSPEDRPARSTALAETLIQEGAPLVGRPGRLLRRSDWWTFVFESDHPDRPEPPIKLLPNKSLEFMVRTSERESIGLVFLVSGEATVFQGENYLLSRVAMQRIDTGNLRR